MQQSILFLLCLLSGSVQAQSDSTDEKQPHPVGWALSSGYHYQQFSGTEALLHLTVYNYSARHFQEMGIFIGSEFNFNNGFNTFTPTAGIETDWFPFDHPKFPFNGIGFTGKLHATVYNRNNTSYLVVAPEIGINFLTFAELYYSYNYTQRTFTGWQPHRIGIRFTIGYPRTVVNVVSFAGGYSN